VKCPECKGIGVDEGTVCYCRNPKCNHRWEIGQRVDANRDLPGKVWESSQAINEDAAELAKEKEFETPPPPPSPQSPPEWEDIFTAPPPPPPQAYHGTCIICGNPKIIQNMTGAWFCGTDHTKEQIIS
jgi:hypothetical protein